MKEKSLDRSQVFPFHFGEKKNLSTEEEKGKKLLVSLRADLRNVISPVTLLRLGGSLSPSLAYTCRQVLFLSRAYGSAGTDKAWNGMRKLTEKKWTKIICTHITFYVNFFLELRHYGLTDA